MGSKNRNLGSSGWPWGTSTKFLHHKLATHIVRSKILSLVRESSVRLEDQTEIKKGNSWLLSLVAWH